MLGGDEFDEEGSPEEKSEEEREDEEDESSLNGEQEWKDQNCSIRKLRSV